MRARPILSYLATAFGAGLAALFMLWLLGPELFKPTAAVSGFPLNTRALPATGPVSYAEAVQRAAPAVINIYSTKITTERRASPLDPPLLQRLFGDRLPLPPRRKAETSLGSGVIVSSDGKILTNHHVIEGADEIKAVLPDGRDLEVRILGSDPETDVAVLRAGSGKLPSIPLGDAARLRVGDVVLAIGNPFGVGQTVTLGIVSATGRSHLGIHAFEDFIQTDAAINPGNSGGALINAQGELIGINNAIYSETGSSHGIGFAIPVELCLAIMEQIGTKGRIIRSWLGISGQQLTPNLAESFGLKVIEGVLVSGVEEQGPAHRAGIRAGDVITQIDGRPTLDTRQVLTLTSLTPPGSRVRLQGWRGNERLDLYLTTADRTGKVSTRR